MRREPKKYLYDVSVAADRIGRFLANKSFADYEADELLRAGVERQFEIMGEALNQLSQVAPELAARIPEYRRIIAFRNILIHAYADVDNAIVWGIASGKLPELRDSVIYLLDDPEDPH